MSIHYKENFTCSKCESAYIPWKQEGVACPSCAHFNTGQYYPFADLFFESLESNIEHGSIEPSAWYNYNPMDSFMSDLFTLFAFHYEQNDNEQENLKSFKDKAEYFFNNQEFRNEHNKIYANKQYFIDIALFLDTQFKKRYEEIKQAVQANKIKVPKQKKWFRIFLP